MVFEMLSIFAIGLSAALGGVVYMLHRRLKKDVGLVMEELQQEVGLILKESLDSLEDTWLDDTEKLIDALDAEVDDLRRDIYLAAKNPSKAKNTLREKYKDLIE